MNQVMLQGVVDHAAQKSDVGAGADLGVDIRLGGAAGVTGIDDNQLAAIFHGLFDPFEGDRMVLGRVAADDEDGVTVFQVNPMVGHGTTTK